MSAATAAALDGKRGWCGELRALGVEAVAKAFGATAVEHRSSHALAPCPACNAKTRHTKRNDKRGAVIVVHQGNGWKCLQCDKTGDAPSWAAYAATGQHKPNAEVRAECERRGLLGGDAASRLRLQPRRAVATPEYPDRAEVGRLIGAGGPVTCSTSVAAWLHSRGFDPQAVADLGAVLALPEDAPMPRWAHRWGKPWPRAGYRLIAPLVDAAGELRSVHTRRDNEKTPKTRNPSECAVTGLVLACPRARRMLSKREAVRRVVVAEGVPDWIQAQLVWMHPVLGIVAGWPQSVANALPRGCRVIVPPHRDGQGEVYFKKIKASLEAASAPRGVTMARVKW